MHQQPQENSQSSNRRSSISVWFCSLSWVSVIATIGTSVALIPAVRTQLIVKANQRVETKNHQIQLQQQPIAPPSVETKNNTSQSQQPKTSEGKTISFTKEIIPSNQIFTTDNSDNNQGKLSKILTQKMSLLPHTRNAQPLIPKSLPQVTPAFEKPIFPLTQSSFQLSQPQEAPPNRTENLVKKETSEKPISPLTQSPLPLTQQQEALISKTNPVKNETKTEINTSINLQPKAQGIRLKLADVVVLVLANNRNIKNAYLDRILQKKDLEVAENKFAPNFTPSLSFTMDRLGTSGITAGNLVANLSARVSVKMPKGGDVSFEWTSNNQSSNLNNNGFGFTQNSRLVFSQPLLRGSGTAINKADIKIARLNEQNNILALKSTLNETITNAIVAYRELLRSQERWKIQRLALKNAEESLQITQALIKAGREAPVTIIQNQADLANQQVNLIAAENQVEARKVALLEILDIDKNTNVFADEIPTIKFSPLDLKNLMQIALLNQPSYLQSQLTIERTKMDVLLADNDKRWDLNFDTSLDNGTNTSIDVRAGISLSRSFGDLSREQRPERSRIELRKAQNSLEDSRSTLEIQLADKIRNINLSLSQVELARQATKLSEKQLEIEQQKQKFGRGSGLFQIIQQQTALVEARNAELDTTINYLNALTDLDLFLGTTLTTWQVTIQN